MMRALVVGVFLAFSIPDADLPVLPGGSAGVATSVAPAACPVPTAPCPGQVTDLRVSMVSDSAVTLSWTEVPSNGTVVAKYDVRFMAINTTKFAWGSAFHGTNSCAPPVYGSTVAGGRTRSCVLSGLLPHIAHGFMLVAYTGTLNVNAVFGPLSNYVDVATAERVGPMIVWRPKEFLDTLSIYGVTTPWGSWQFNAHLRYGSYLGTLTDSLGATKARGYLLLTRP